MRGVRGVSAKVDRAGVQFILSPAEFNPIALAANLLLKGLFQIATIEGFL